MATLLEFGSFSALFQACGKLPTLHGSPWSFIFDEFGGHWSFVIKSGQLACSQFCALRGTAHCVLTHRPPGR